MSPKPFCFFVYFQINLTFREDLPVQVDGEPWLQPACVMIVRPTPIEKVWTVISLFKWRIGAQGRI